MLNPLSLIPSVFFSLPTGVNFKREELYPPPILRHGKRAPSHATQDSPPSSDCSSATPARSQVFCFPHNRTLGVRTPENRLPAVRSADRQVAQLPRLRQTQEKTEAKPMSEAGIAESLKQSDTPKILDAHSRAFIGVHPSIMHPGRGTIYILIDERAAFDLIDLPMTDHGPKPNGHVITKVIDGDQYIIFQYWISEKPSMR